MNILTEYIKYRRKAKKRHGIHSPFIYDFSDSCVSILFPSDLKKERNDLINSIRNSKKIIRINDFGAGSLKMTDKRPLNEILKYSSSNGKWGEFLFKICKHYQPENILELGTSLGLGTWHMNKGNPCGKLTSIEGCPETYTAARNYVYPFLNENVQLIRSTFDTFLDNLDTVKFDLIFIDGHHDGDALINYINRLLPLSNNETLFLLDDIRWSKSMLSAWKRLVSDSQFNVTVDLFRMGLLVKRPSQEKEHFVLRV